jgi:hypothetical protein
MEVIVGIIVYRHRHCSGFVEVKCIIMPLCDGELVRKRELAALDRGTEK